MRTTSQRKNGFPLPLAAWVFIAVLVPSAYFFSGATANPNSRYDLVYALVEDHSFQIDRFVNERHLDWSRFDGHYYSNKGPGTALLGAVAYAPLHAVERAMGRDPGRDSRLVTFNAYVINFFASTLWLAVGAWALFSLLLKTKKLTHVEAAACAAVYTLSTLTFPYASSLWGHATAAGLVCLSLERLAPLESVSNRRASIAGFLAAFAAITEYTSGLAVVLLGLALIVRRRKSAAAHFALGVCVPLAFLLIYQASCFASPFATSYRDINPAIANAWSAPQPLVLWRLLFSEYRGLFIYCPIALVAAVGLVLSRKARVLSGETAVAAGFALGLVVTNASFSGWHGGSCAGPRYLIPALPLLGLGLAFLPKARWVRAVAALAAAASALNMLVIVAVTPFVLQERASPLAKLYRGFFAGDMALPLESARSSAWVAPGPRYVAFNFGQLIGLEGLCSLIPLAAFFVAMGFVLAQLKGGRRAP